MRVDPLLKLALGRLLETEEDFASQPTISRLKNAVGTRECYRMVEALLKLYVGQRGKDSAPKRVLLDLDSTDYTARSDQEGAH